MTICCEDRRLIFDQERRCSVAVATLKRISVSMHFFVHAYCVMPDHVHVLVEGETPASNLIQFIALWKQMTGYLFRKELPKRFWQRRFYDHALRKATDSEGVAWYIWMNPVRKGVVLAPQEYPFSGSFTIDWPRNAPSEVKWLPPWKAEEGRAKARPYI